MNKKSVLCGLMAAVMALSLCSCAKEKEPTAEELMAGLTEQTKVCTAHMDMNMTYAMDMSSEGLDGTMEMNAEGYFNIEAAENANHLSGEMKVGLLGITQVIQLNTYSVKNEDGTTDNYTYDSDTGEWQYSTEGIETMEGLLDMPTDTFSDLTLTTDGDTYIVSGIVDMSDSDVTFLDNGLTGEEEATDETQPMNMDVKFIFNKKDKTIQKAEMTLVNEDASETTEDAAQTMSLSVVIEYDVNADVKVEVPEAALAAKE